MIKLKELIKEETKHVCECGGDCCKTSVNESLDLPKSMELGKVFTGQGKAFMKEEDLNERKLSSYQKKAILIAIEMSGNMTNAVKKIERIKKGLSNDKKVKDALRLANESVNEEWTLYTTTQYGKKLQKLKSYKSRKAATIALGKLSAKLDTPRFPKNVDGLMIIDEAFKNESVNEAVEQETNIPFEMIGKSYISVKGRKLTTKLQFKGNDLQDVVNGKKKKGKVVLASITTK